MVFIAVAFISFLAGMEIDIFIPSYPELQKQFGLSPAKVQLCLSVNFITYCIGSIYAGALGDRFGLRKVILYGLGVFLVGSIACTFASNFEFILMGRALQGLGMAAPAVLAFVVIAKQVPLEKQASTLGMLNGFTTMAMAAAPVIGSWVALYAGWRGNFAALMILALVSFSFAWLILPKDHQHDKNIAMSLQAYLPFLRSKIFRNYLIMMTTYCCAYWAFIGMGSILYIEGLGVPLEHFGYYQGAIAACFGFVSFASPKLLCKYGHQKCYKTAIIMVSIVATLIGVVAAADIRNPLLITVLMCMFSMPVVFPVNIIYPLMLNVIPGGQSRAAALSKVAQLISSAICIEGVSYFYDGRFLQLGLLIFVLSIVGFLMARTLGYWKNAQ